MAAPPTRRQGVELPRQNELVLLIGRFCLDRAQLAVDMQLGSVSEVTAEYELNTGIDTRGHLVALQEMQGT